MNTKKVIAALYSVSNGISTGTTMGWPLYKKTRSLAIGITTAAISSTIDSYNSYAFQGQSIINKPNDNDDEDYLPESSPSCTTTTLQILYTLFATAKTYADRYFLFTVLIDLFSLSVSSPVFYTVLAADVLIKQSFDMTNVLYEANEMIQKKIDRTKGTPFYRNLFNPIASSCKRTFFTALGSLEHTLGDDLLPLLAFIPQAVIRDFAENKNPRNIALISLFTIIGAALITLVFIQTYLFEGGHTQQHLANAEEAEETEPLSSTMYSILDKSLLLMGPFHGAAAAMPVYVTLKEMLTDPTKSLICSLTATIFTFINVTIGTCLSEVRESREKLREMASNEAYRQFSVNPTNHRV